MSTSVPIRLALFQTSLQAERSIVIRFADQMASSPDASQMNDDQNEFLTTAIIIHAQMLQLTYQKAYRMAKPYAQSGCTCIVMAGSIGLLPDSGQQVSNNRFSQKAQAARVAAANLAFWGFGPIFFLQGQEQVPAQVDDMITAEKALS